MKSLQVPLLLLLVGTGAAAAQDSDRVGKDAIDKPSLCAISRKPPCSIKIAIRRGLFPTGLQPLLAPEARCRVIDEHYAINYTYKRGRESYHGGIDMPAPFGTPIVAAAAGTVVGIYSGERGRRGREIILRHTPKETGIPVYIYTIYGHLNRMPQLSVGDNVRMGEVLGPTGNSGIAGRRVRRPAIHFAVFYSASPKYAALPHIVIPADAYWMDPVALYRKTPPFDSAAMKALPARDKQVPIPYMLADGSVHPHSSKLIWPYVCASR
jgi:murein DD-endopeptidase MepM/ murein hydrolase activator NlpD